MTVDELRSALHLILERETRRPTDWTTVEEHCLEVVRRLVAEPNPAYPHDVVYHFLEDADVRQKSDVYAEHQRHTVRDWLNVR